MLKSELFPVISSVTFWRSAILALCDKKTGKNWNIYTKITGIVELV